MVDGGDEEGGGGGEAFSYLPSQVMMMEAMEPFLRLTSTLVRFQF